MKKIPKDFHTKYPYLAYFKQEKGDMLISDGKNYPFISLMDVSGNIYTDWETSDQDEALKMAERYLRIGYFPHRVDKATIAALEEDYKKFGLS